MGGVFLRGKISQKIQGGRHKTQETSGILGGPPTIFLLCFKQLNLAIGRH